MKTFTLPKISAITSFTFKGFLPRSLEGKVSPIVLVKELNAGEVDLDQIHLETKEATDDQKHAAVEHKVAKNRETQQMPGKIGRPKLRVFFKVERVGDQRVEMKERGHQTRHPKVKEELDEKPLIVLTDAVVDEEAVVVELVNAFIAVPTVVEAGVLQTLTQEAELDVGGRVEVDLVQFHLQSVVELPRRVLVANASRVTIYEGEESARLTRARPRVRVFDTRRSST